MATTVTAAAALLEAARLVFWDFDGVIKESVAVKSLGFELLFRPYGTEIAQRVRRHHEAHGGVSRFEKLRIYLDWVGEPVTETRVAELCARFSQLVMQGVIDSPWVPGVREYLHSHHARQHFVLITATPQQEIERILETLALTFCFHSIYGAPLSKSEAIRATLASAQCAPERALVVGDAETDFAAARTNEIPFLLRRTDLNQPFQDRYSGPAFDDLKHEPIQ